MKLALMILAAFLILQIKQYQAALTQPVISNHEINWKEFAANWTNVTNATNYHTILSCETSSKKVIKSTLNIVYNDVPTNESCSFHVKASNTNEMSQLTNITFVSAGSPIPDNLTITNHEDHPTSQLNLKWDHSNSLSSKRLQSIRYNIRYSSSQTATSLFVNVTTDYMVNSYTLKGLESNTIYWIQVSAYDERSKELGSPAKSIHLTARDGISNLVVALAVIATAVGIILTLGFITRWHFRSKYS